MTSVKRQKRTGRRGTRQKLAKGTAAPSAGQPHTQGEVIMPSTDGERWLQAFNYARATEKALRAAVIDIEVLVELEVSPADKAKFDRRLAEAKLALHDIDDDLDALTAGEIRIKPPAPGLIERVKELAGEVEELAATSANAEKILSISADVLARYNEARKG